MDEQSKLFGHASWKFEKEADLLLSTTFVGGSEKSIIPASVDADLDRLPRECIERSLSDV